MVDLHLSEGADVFKKDDVGNSLYVIVSGRVRLHNTSTAELILKEKQTFGLLAALDPEPRIVTATALEQTHLFRLDGDTLYDLMSDDVEITRGVIRVLCKRIRQKL